ncbi:phage tail sheath subtilisin-like domain-containing protein [Acinetobacter chinensis]|uniref:Phage tail sheath subtilisin-like domain-containing protein n=1 Tax=Acinetobacter chinensis TaxID=2004650 RepID=A0ABU3WIW6_9GAMM|nr:phage tail sheath subtilisin-like domain-containing protein [Acinetobacter chinensis]MDV2469827.1 phage tail sheath subtilisin-like domain-containing protein [Acinetobacter chinensis]
MTLIYGPGIFTAAVAAAALRAETDKKIGWHKSLSNIPVTGPTGISLPITWDLEDPDTDAGYLNSNDITTMILHDGPRFWGNRNCSDDPRFSFEVATRTAQFLLDTIINGCFPFIDQPLTPFLAKDIIDSINAKLTEHVGAKHLIGAAVWYDEAENSEEQLSQGLMWIDYDYTPVPTLENLGLNQRITDRYLVDFGQLINNAA